MNIKTYKLGILLLLLPLLLGCGVKRYHETPSCDDLDTVFLDAMTDELSDGQKETILAYNSLLGDWTVRFKCDGDPESRDANLKIDKISDSNVELYVDVDESDCNSYGKAVFEATVTDSGDDDLDNHLFFLTADLLIDSSESNVLEANTEQFKSTDEAVNTFQFKVVVKTDQTLEASKFVTSKSVSSKKVVTVSQWVKCTLTDWQKQR